MHRRAWCNLLPTPPHVYYISRSLSSECMGLLVDSETSQDGTLPGFCSLLTLLYLSSPAIPKGLPCPCYQQWHHSLWPPSKYADLRQPGTNFTQCSYREHTERHKERVGNRVTVCWLLHGWESEIKENCTSQNSGNSGTQKNKMPPYPLSQGFLVHTGNLLNVGLWKVEKSCERNGKKCS